MRGWCRSAETVITPPTSRQVLRDSSVRYRCVTTVWNRYRTESGPILTFYMGKNTPERKDYIMDKLVVPVEE
jgi:hypothetical protein